jgi:hypothetical protein
MLMVIAGVDGPGMQADWMAGGRRVPGLGGERDALSCRPPGQRQIQGRRRKCVLWCAPRQQGDTE